MSRPIVVVVVVGVIGVVGVVVVGAGVVVVRLVCATRQDSAVKLYRAVAIFW